MEKRIQQIIDRNIEKKIELIKSLRGKEDKDNPIMNLITIIKIKY